MNSFPAPPKAGPIAGSTFRDCLGRVDDAKAMGFDVIYFPPIHPDWPNESKGRNNSVTCRAGRTWRPLRDRQSPSQFVRTAAATRTSSRR